MKRDAEEICQKYNITDDDLKQICKRYLVKEGYDFRKFWVNEIEFEDFASNTLGYLGYHLKLTINVSPKSVVFADELDQETSDDDDSEDRNLTFFVKLFPLENEKQADYVEKMKIFEKETQLFEFLIPRLQDIAIGAKEWAAQSYLSKDDKVLIVENLRLEGFRAPELKNFDLEHLIVASTVLGRFHASSIILEDRCRDSIPNLYPDCLYETSYPDDPSHVRSSIRQFAISVLLALVHKIPRYKCDYLALEMIERKLPVLINQIVDFVKPSKKFRNVFSHGDLWLNNFLFQYNKKVESVSSESSDDESNTESDQEEEHETDNKDSEDVSEAIGDLICVLKEEKKTRRRMVPKDARLVDFQLARYTPPALDLMVLIYTTTTADFRRRYFEEICKNYYESLRVELDRLGIAVEDEVSDKDFRESLEFYKMAGMIECLLFCQLTALPEEANKSIFANSETFGNFMETGNRVEVCKKNFDDDPTYRSIMTDMITQFVDDYILEVTAL